MKKIAIVIDSLVGGGAEKVMLTLATTLTQMGHSVTLLSLAASYEYDVPAGLNVMSLFTGNASKVDSFWQRKKSVAALQSWFNEQQSEHGEFDLVLSNLDKSNNLLSQSNINKVHYIVHNSVEAELARQKRMGPLKYAYLLAAKKRLNGKSLVCVSKGLQKEIEQGALINPARIQTIYNPFDFAAIEQLSNQTNEQIPNEPYLIHVGRLAKQKRHDVLFSALAKMERKIKLVLLCNKPQKALKMAEKYGVAEQIIVPGFQQNPYNWIKNAEALVLSSDYEGLSMVLIEALAVGTKVVSTLCPHGPSEVLSGELAQFLVPMNNPQRLAEKITQALQADINPQQAEILQQVQGEHVAKQYLALCD